MPPYARSSRSSRTEPTTQRGNLRNPKDEFATTSRAWTITSNDEQHFRVPSQAPPQSARQAAPSQYTPSSHQTRRNSNDSTGTDSPVCIRSPTPGSRNPADGAQTFREWLQSDPKGPRLSREEASRVIDQLTYDELLQDDRKSAYEQSVAAQSQTANSASGCNAPSEKPVPAQSRTIYSESVYSSNAPPSAYCAGCVPLRVPSTSSRTSRWVDDVRESVVGASLYPRSTQSRRGDDEHSRR